MCVPALLGLEYPDPMGSGLSVPVLGSQADLLTGSTVPLAGTMEDPSGTGLVPIRIGSLTVDPVTGVLAPVVGARLDVSRKTIVPLTVSNWLSMCDHVDAVQAEALQREACVRSQYWQQQGQKEEKLLSDFLGAATQANCDQVVHILTQGDEEEWELQCLWHSQLMSCLDSLEVTVERVQRDQEKGSPHQDMDWDLRQKELSQQFCSRQAELETVVTNLQSTRHLSLLRADTAQAVLCRKFWYKDYGLCQLDGPRPCVKVVGLVQQKALPLLEKLRQLLEDKQPTSLSPSTYWQHIGLSTKQASGLEMSRAWTASVPVVKEEDWDKLLQLSPLFQLLRKVELKLKEQALDAGLLRGEFSDQSNRFVDVLDAQWACEGELIPLDVQTLTPREFLAYQHGLFLLKLLHTLKLEAEERLFVRRQRLQSVGGFSLLLLHCLSHVSIGDMSSDSNPTFQRLFFKSLQVCLGELFQARLGELSFGQEALGTWFPSTSLLDRLHRPSRGVLSQHEETALEKRNSETSLFTRVEELLREKSC
ncbi:hypothetical protein CRUP_028055 [Coryphaenoides rupestris]|nr:hypothetical protein CRUP_028055 [Coryphaenoides rupestris]